MNWDGSRAQSTELCGVQWSGFGRTAMLRKSVAVVAAMRRELAPLLRGIEPRQADGMEFFELESAVIAIGGIGSHAAARAAEAVVAKYEPSVIVSAGIAGALTARLKAGDIVHAREVVDADTDSRFAASDGTAVILTVSSVSGPAEKRKLAERWKADVVDMEAAAIAAVAQNRGIEFAALKAISDEVDFVMPPVGEFVDQAGKFQTLRFATYIAARPKWWDAVKHLNSNSKVASVKLSEALQHLIDQRSASPPRELVSGA
jgi:adenosylhomocysteine nucleosidase